MVGSEKVASDAELLMKVSELMRDLRLIIWEAESSNVCPRTAAQEQDHIEGTKPGEDILRSLTMPMKHCGQLAFMELAIIEALWC
eukprot:584932-Amphidinium_carterae.1